MSVSDMTAPGYESLAAVLQAAFNQAAEGKGAERHANGKPFHEQPMQVGSDLLGTDAGLAFQAIKKLREGSAFEELERWEREALGAINYIAGMVIWRRRQAGGELWPGQHDTNGLAERKRAIPLQLQTAEQPKQSEPGVDWSDAMAVPCPERAVLTPIQE